MPCACRPHMPLISLALPSLFHLVIEHLCTPLSTPVPSLRKETHTIGRTKRAHTSPGTCQHAVTAPRPNPGRARTPPCPVALVLPSPCPLARAITTPPATYWTCSLARGRLVTVAMIRARPHPYCQHSIVASPPQTPFSRAVKLTSTTRMPATLRDPYLAPSITVDAAP